MSTLSPNWIAFPPESVIRFPLCICNVEETFIVESDSSVSTPVPSVLINND